MRPVDRLLAHYGSSHQNPINKAIHWLCVPSIVFSLLAVLWYVRWPDGPRLANGAVALAVGGCFYYVRLSPRLALGAGGLTLLLLGLCYGLEAILPFPLWEAALAVFVVAWIGQFIGHAIEGKKPSAFEDVRYLMIGPLWLLSFVYRKFRISY